MITGKHPNRGKRILAGIAAAFFLAVSVWPGYVTAEKAETETVEETARKVTVDPMGRSEGYAAVLYDNTNGLPTSEANAIAESSEGFLWIGSYSGLIRYDGNTFERMDSTTGIASVVCLYVDSKNRLWVGTNDSGVAVLDREEEYHFNKAEGLKSATVRSITEDAEGNVYVATTHGLAVVDQNMKMHSIDELQINEEYVRFLTTGVDNVIYGLTMEGAVFTMKDGKLTGFYEGAKIGISDVHAIYADPSNPGFLYLGTKGSELYYGKLDGGFNNPQRIDVSPLTYVNQVKCFQDQLWVCADNGIGIVENGRCQKLENIPLVNSIEQVTTDYQGNLWFTSSRQGVMKIVPDQFMDVFECYELDSQVVNTTCFFEGRLFIGTDDGLTVVDKEKPLESLPLEKAVTASGENLDSMDLIEILKGRRIRSIVRDGEERLWFSTYGAAGLLRYDHGVVTMFSTKDGLPSDRIRTVIESKDGTIMVACTGGIAMIEGDRVTEVYNEASGISNTEILTVAEGKNGEVVVGTDGDGIYVIRGKKCVHVGTDEGLQSGVVMRIKHDVSRGVYWVVTSNSLAYVTEDYQVTTIRKFPYPNNFDIIENEQGQIWVLSSNGIYVVSSEELLKNEDIHPVFYNRDNGLSCVPTANSYSDLTADGDLYVAGSTGVVRVNVDKPFENVNEFKIAVPYVEADGVRIFPDESGSFTIPAKVSKLTIYGHVFVYTLMNPQVTYYLDGFEKTATTVSRSDFGEVSYTNLRGGTYHFVIRLKDSEGRGNRELSVQIVKQKALHELWWFQTSWLILVGIVIALIVVWYVRRKTKALLKKQEENKLLIREITEAFAMTIDMKDRYTRGHSTRVAEYTAMLTKELGYDEETVDNYYNIALLHDIGKIGIPPEVLNKQGPLTDQEFGVIKSHSALGYEALKKIRIMPELAVGARSHHERPDGKGYPQGLKGDEIPRVAQIIAVADTFDAMYSDRPYRKRMNFERAVSIIKEVSGTQLTPDVVEAFLRLVEKGEFRDPNDHGGGSMEDINNIHAKQEKKEISSKN